MDATDTDFDIKLQKISGDLIADLDRALTTAFRKPDGHGGTQVRLFVKARDIFKSTTDVLDMFQELPQLLDPHLPKWIPLLANSYLEYGEMRHRIKTKAANQSSLLVPVDHAICRIIYAFCKVRGEKVIVRFLNVETKYLELLLATMEEAEEKAQGGDPKTGWQWEQRYVVLLWLSHLFLAPFDLSTISTLDAEEGGNPVVRGFVWPEDLPGITVRVIPMAIKYLSSPGKEKDAAKALLVRLAMRRDMQQLGVLDSLVQWALASLKPQTDEPLQSTYFYLGVLSFLAGVLRSSVETSDMNSHLAGIFHTAHEITLGANELSRSIIKLAIVRKMIIKVIRSVVVSLLRQSKESMANTEMTETAIGYLLDSLPDNDTPVRLSASKSLSIVTLKLGPDMASQVVEAVLELLNRKVLWTKPSDGQTERPVRNLSAVNHLEWHGLMLTLSHLLYRRSPPADQLSDIIHALLLGLSFEQRNTSGGSVGSNVRDAACFGIWALARRYTTKELLGIPTTSVFAAKAHPSSSSILQVLATELVVTGSLDSAGNIRRGASAALQELIGRHPDTVERGIEVVQTVDYHAVARRSRAIEEVATKVTELSGQYGEALVDALLGWRGVGDLEASSRRVAGATFGVLTALMAKSDQPGLSRFISSIQLVAGHIASLAKRQVEERHGLLLCLTSIINEVVKPLQSSTTDSETAVALVSLILQSLSDVLNNCREVEYRKPELIAEAASRLVVSSIPAIQRTFLSTTSGLCSIRGEEILSSAFVRQYVELVCRPDASPVENGQSKDITVMLEILIPSWLTRSEPETVEPAAQAALALLALSPTEDRERILRAWAGIVQSKPASRSSTTGQGYFQALAMAQPMAAHLKGDRDALDIVCQSFLRRWEGDDDVDTRVVILQSLVRSQLLRVAPMTFLVLLRQALDDYTMTARGDVGSHVRVQALRAVRNLWEDLDNTAISVETLSTTMKTLFHPTLRLAAEKLDRVRPEAQAAVALLMQPSVAKPFQYLTFSSATYFENLLGLIWSDSLRPTFSSSAKGDRAAWMAELMAGFVTSADTGNEDLVIASRAALMQFCQASHENLHLVCTALEYNLRLRHGDDRISVPTMEIIAFLFHVGLFQRCQDIKLRNLCLYTQKAGYKSGNIKKILACIKVYGGVANFEASSSGTDICVLAGVKESRKRLGALMFHPWPRVRSAVVDELWGLLDADGVAGDKLTSVDWSAADKSQIKQTVLELGLE